MYINTRIGKNSLIALVDTGASGFAFISTSVCNRLHLKPKAKVSFSLAIGRHVEELSAFVIDSCKNDLILGHYFRRIMPKEPLLPFRNFYPVPKLKVPQ